MIIAKIKKLDLGCFNDISLYVILYFFQSENIQESLTCSKKIVLQSRSEGVGSLQCDASWLAEGIPDSIRNHHVVKQTIPYW